MESRDLTIGTSIGDVSALEWGRSGPRVLLVHGAGANAAAWNAVAERLPGLHLVAVDLRGHGRSTLRNADSEQYWRDLGPIVEALGWDRPVLVGHSLGGYAVTAAAATGAVTPAGIVVLDGFVPNDRATVLAQQADATSPQALATYREVFRYGWAGSPDEVSSYIEDVVRDQEEDPLFAGASPELIRAWLGRCFVPHGDLLLRAPDIEDVVAFSTVRSDQAVVPCREVYDGLRVPTLLAVAERGYSVDAVSALKSIAASHREVALVTGPTGHNMVATHPGLVAQVILRLAGRTRSLA